MGDGAPGDDDGLLPGQHRALVLAVGDDGDGGVGAGTAAPTVGDRVLEAEPVDVAGHGDLHGPAAVDDAEDAGVGVVGGDASMSRTSQSGSVSLRSG